MMPESMKRGFAVMCLMPWLAMALAYALSTQCGDKDFIIVKTTAVLICVVLPPVIYAFANACFEAGQKVVTARVENRKATYK